MPDARQHPLFWRFPLSGTAAVLLKDLPTPFHVFDGHGLMITGQGDAAIVARSFVDQDVFPVLTASGRAAMALFLGDCTDASLGAHRILQVMALCAPARGQVIADGATAFLAAMAMQPDLGLFHLHQWNDNATVVAYSTQYLGLDATHCTASITRGKRLLFGFHEASGGLLATGDLTLGRISSLRASFALIRQIGLHPVLRLARQPFAQTHLVNRKSAVLPRNARARRITAADRRVIAGFDPKRDRLTLSGPLEAYDFKPLCLEHFAPCRFVQLHPDT